MASASRALLLSRALQAGAAFRSVPTFLRPLAAAWSLRSAGAAAAPPVAGVRCFETQPATPSLSDSSPNWSKRSRPSKEAAVLDGCDFEHWLVVMEPPPGDASNPDISRDEIIHSYIKTLAQVVGSDEEARQKIYLVSTRHYFAFGALVSEELSYRLKELPKVRWVLPDSYLDVKNKDYGGEPFINGEAVPYDPKYHEEWVRNNRIRQPRHGGGNLGYPGGDLGYQAQGSDSDDQGEGNDSRESDLDDSGDGSNSDDGSKSDDSENGRDLDTRTTTTTEVTRTREVTKTTEATRMTEVTQTTKTTRTTQTTEVTRTTKRQEATRRTRTTEATQTTKAKEATRTTSEHAY